MEGKWVMVLWGRWVENDTWGYLQCKSILYSSE